MTLPTVAAPPSTTDVAAQLLATMASLSGVATDYNAGSQIRTMSEALGSVTEMQGVAAQTLAFQAAVYSALALFNITPAAAIPATGVVTFSTAPGLSPPAATQAVAIPAGTLVQTAGGIQFSTLADATLISGASSVSTGVQAVVAGTGGNVSAGTINQLISSLGYTLFVTNSGATGGGLAAETSSQAMARFAAAAASLGLSSPVAVANACIGVSYSGEVVRYAACVEPWIEAGTGPGSGTAGFNVYLDNGTGTAGSGLISAVETKLRGDYATQQSGYRPAGVPYTVAAVSPVYADVVVSGTVLSVVQASTIETAVDSSIRSYFSALGFQEPAEQSQIAAAAANAGLGYFGALTVSLYYSGSGTAVQSVTGASNSRIILNSLTVDLG